MILVDANLLLYAHDKESAHHSRSRSWLEGTLAGPEPVRLAWMVVLAFLRIVTDPRALRRPMSIAEAVSVVGEWLEHPNFGLLHPTDRHWAILSDLLPAAQARGPLVMDAHLAALAIEHGATLCSTDRDFTRFPRLRFSNPLEQQRR